MMKRRRKFDWRFLVFCLLYALLGFAFIFMILSLATFTTIFNRGFFEWQQEINNTIDAVNVSAADLELLTTKIMRYFFGLDESLQTFVTFLNNPGTLAPFYTVDELSHMADVKVFFDIIKWCGILLPFAIGAALFFIIKYDKDALRRLSAGALVVSILILIIIIPIGIGLAVDFDAAFEMFHTILFPQGNYQFGFDSHMLAMLHESLFYTAAVIIFVPTVISIVGLTAFGITGVTISIKRRTKSQH